MVSRFVPLARRGWCCPPSPCATATDVRGVLCPFGHPTPAWLSRPPPCFFASRCVHDSCPLFAMVCLPSLPYCSQRPKIHRVVRPSRPDKARRLGYKAKQGASWCRGAVIVAWGVRAKLCTTATLVLTSGGGCRAPVPVALVDRVLQCVRWHRLPAALMDRAVVVAAGC